jgi:hypothetical protein
VPIEFIMAPHLILVVAGLTSVWAVLSIIGGERQRVLQNAELLRRATASEAQATASAQSAAATGKSTSSASGGKKPAR